MTSLARQLIEELRSDEELRRELAEELLPEIAKNRRLRLAIIASIYRDLATKEDLEDLKRKFENLEKRFYELEKRFHDLENRFEHRFDDLDKRLTRVEAQLGLFIKLFIAFNVPILIGIIGILLKMVYSP